MKSIPVVAMLLGAATTVQAVEFQATPGVATAASPVTMSVLKQQVEAMKASTAVTPGVLSKADKIISTTPLGVGGLVVWTVEKGGKRMTFYATPDGKALIAGTVWDATTGQNLTRHRAPVPVPDAGSSAGSDLPLASQEPAAPSFAMSGKFAGTVPESIKTVSELAGIKEGKGGTADTVYIVIDPRCPYCRKAYLATREYVKRGYSIKWIPAIALGEPEQGIPIAASLLQSWDHGMLDRILGQHQSISARPTPETIKHLESNASFLFATFQQNGGAAGVPVAFFLDHRTGKPRMSTGISENVILKDIFGQL